MEGGGEAVNEMGLAEVRVCGRMGERDLNEVRTGRGEWRWGGWRSNREGKKGDGEGWKAANGRGRTLMCRRRSLYTSICASMSSRRLMVRSMLRTRPRTVSLLSRMLRMLADCGQ